MDLGNFYTSFGILLVYFTLVWQNIRQKNITQNKDSKQLIDTHNASASIENCTSQLDNLWSSILNPLNITISIISISGMLAFFKIFVDNYEKINFNVQSIVLISIALMHIVISIDLWIINFKIIHKIIRVKSLKKIKSSS